MTRLADAIYNSVNQDVLLKKSKYQACRFDNHLSEKTLKATCKNIASSPVFLIGTAVVSILVLRNGKFTILRRFVILKQLANSLLN